MKKNLVNIMICSTMFSLNAMHNEPWVSIDLGDENAYRSATEDEVYIIDMGIDSEISQDEVMPPEGVTSEIYHQKGITDKYQRAHLLLMIQELYERSPREYRQLINELIPKRARRHRQNHTVDRLCSGLTQIKQSVDQTNKLIQDQIDGGEEQARIDTFRWRCDYVSNCCCATLGLVVGILGTSIVASMLH